MTEVLRGDSGYAQLHPGQVDPGVLPQPAAVQDGADDLLAHDLLYLQGDLSVLEEGAVAGTDGAGQRRVAIGDDRFTGAGSGRRATVGDQPHGVAHAQVNGTAGQRPGAQFGSGQIKQHGDLPPTLPSQVTQ